MSALLQNFQRSHKGIKISFTASPWGQFETHLQTEFLAKGAPDVFAVDGGWVRDFIQAKTLQPLGPFLKRDKSFHAANFVGGPAGDFVFNRHTYAYPMYYTTLALWYDKAMFKAHRIKHPPTDWKSFARASCELTNARKHVFGAAIAADPARWFAFLKSFGGRVLNQRHTKPSIDSQQSVQALKWYGGLVRRGCAESPAQAAGDATEFGKKKVAMTFEPVSMAAMMREQFPKIKWGIAPLPTGPKGNGNLAFATGWAMNAKSKVKSAAWKLIRYLCSRNAIIEWTARTHYLPGRRPIKPPNGIQPFVKGASYATQWAWPPALALNAFPQIADDIDKVAKNQLHYKTAVADMANWIRRYLS